MRVAVILLLLAGSALHFDLTDASGRKASGVTLQAGAPDADGWRAISLKGKGDAVLVWPPDDAAKQPDGPGPVHAIVIQRGDEKSLENPHIGAALAVPVAMATSSLEQIAARTGLSPASLQAAFSQLSSSGDPMEKGAGLLLAGESAKAADTLSRALKDRQRQLTRVPSEIYPAAMLYGRALLLSGQFDRAAVAFLMASKQRPSDGCAIRWRADALSKAGKTEAAELLVATGTAPCRRRPP